MPIQFILLMAVERAWEDEVIGDTELELNRIMAAL
jgi:hypothetical protein